MVTMGLYLPLATVLTTCDLDIISQNIPFFSHSKWLRNGYVTQFRPSRVLLRTFPLELIPKISPTLEIAKLEGCEPEAAGGHVAFKEDKSYWKMNLRERERDRVQSTLFELWNQPCLEPARSNRCLIYSKIFCLSFLPSLFFLPSFLPFSLFFLFLFFFFT